MTRPAAAVLALLLVISAAGAGAQDWPEFRGPTGQGHSQERGIPFEWSEARNITWKTAVPGTGWSSPVVAGGRVWLTTALPVERGTISLRLLAFDAATGREVVNVEVFRPRPGPSHQKNSYASPTPIVAGARPVRLGGPDPGPLQRGHALERR